MTATTVNITYHPVYTVTFDGKPAPHILAGLKANGFRWDPLRGFWYLAAARRLRDGFLRDLDREFNPDKPDGNCWSCKAPGRFRYFGPATPVLCDACYKLECDHRKAKGYTV